MQLAKRLIPAILFYLACAFVASAQSTTVSGTVTDAGSQVWLNGTYSFTFQPNPQYPTGPYTWTGGTLNTNISGSLDGSGHYSVSIPSNSAITPAGSTWILTVTPNATSNSFSTPRTTITGGTQALNVTPPAIAINWSLPPGPALSAYADAEIKGTLPPGAEYFNTTTLLTRVWNGSAWGNQGSGSGGGVTSVTGTSPIVATPTTGAVGVSCPTCLTQTTGSGVQGEPAIYQSSSLSIAPSDQTVDVSAFGQATWTQDVVAAYGSAACASGCTLIVPDSEAAKGSGAATTPVLPGNTSNVGTVNLTFTGSAVFQECTLQMAPFSTVRLGKATLKAATGSSNCNLLYQPVFVSEQNGAKNLVLDGTIDCNSTVACSPVSVGDTTSFRIERTALINATDTTSTISAPTAGLVFQATQFAQVVGVKFYNDYVGHKCYNSSSGGGCNSNYYDNINIATGCTVGTIYGYQGTTFSPGGNTFKNPVIQNCSVASQANFGNPNICSGILCQSAMYIDSGAPENNGGGASSVTIDGFTIKQASVYVNYTDLFYSNVDVAEATITPIIDAENNSIVQLFNPGGGAGQTFVTTDATSMTQLLGANVSPTATGSSGFGNWGTYTPQKLATSGANQSSPQITYCGNLWTGSASALDCWGVQTVLGSGANPATTFKIAHPTVGGSGFTDIDLTAATQVSLPDGTYQNATQFSVGGNLAVAGTSFLAAMQASQLKVYDVTGGTTFGATETSQFLGCEASEAPTTVNTGSATTTTGVSCIPANAFIDGVTYRITTAITTATSFTVGISGSTSKFCATQSTLTLGTSFTCAAQVNAGAAYSGSSAVPVVVTFNATPGAGAMRLIVFYHIVNPPTS